jgi:hypothetical protein
VDIRLLAALSERNHGIDIVPYDAAAGRIMPCGAPTAWALLGVEPGGASSVADGYQVLLASLVEGQHKVVVSVTGPDGLVVTTDQMTVTAPTMAESAREIPHCFCATRSDACHERAGSIIRVRVIEVLGIKVGGRIAVIRLIVAQPGICHSKRTRSIRFSSRRAVPTSM